MTAIVRRPDVALRMARITWYRHRWAVVAILGVFGAATAVLIVEGTALRVWLDDNGMAQCVGVMEPYGISACAGKPGWNNLFSIYIARDTAYALLVVPPAAALLGGLPWLTREFETGGFRYTWVQGIKPVRWLLGVFGSLTAIAIVAAAVCGVASDWWYRVAQWPVAVMPAPGWGWDAFGLSPIALVGWTVFAMALAMLVAVVIRRTVPAMAAFAATYAGCLIFTLWWLCPHLLRLAPVVARGQWGTGFSLDAPHWKDLGITWWLTGPNGSALTGEQFLNMLGAAGPRSTPAQQAQWLVAHHDTYWIAYQPHARLVVFQLALALLLLALSALSVLAAVVLLRRQSRR